MNDQSKTKRELIQELVSLRKQIAELSQYESEQKKAEESLLESEDKYKSLIENIPDIIIRHHRPRKTYPNLFLKLSSGTYNR